MGGSGAGAISHSAYMETVHKDLLNLSGLNTPTLGVVQAMNTAFLPASNPFTGALPYNPDTDLLASSTAVAALKTLVNALAYVTDVQTAVSALAAGITADVATLDVATLDTATLAVDVLDVFVIDETLVKADILAYSASLEADLVDLTIPKFRASMFNIGAVLTSGFVLGEAVLRKEKLRQVAVFEADLRQKLQIQANDINAKFRIQHKDKATELRIQFDEITTKFKLDFKELTAKFKIQNQEITANFKNQRWVTIRALTAQALQDLMKKTELETELVRFTLESNRLKVIAKTEQTHEALSLVEHDRKWNLDMFTYGTTVLGGIGSGALIPGKKSKAVSALSGALSGAAAGASAGGGIYTTAAGAIIGGVAGYLSA